MEATTRKAIVEVCVWLDQNGYNQMTSGNVSVRYPGTAKQPRDPQSLDDTEAIPEGLLITPSGISAQQLSDEKIVRIGLDYQPGKISGGYRPSSEWRLHRDILLARPDINVVIHTHSTFATAIAMTRSEIPACHYMIAAFGGDNIRCAPYAMFGTQELSTYAVEAMKDRMGCLLSNHGMVVVGKDLQNALWYAVQLENLAQQYYYSRLFGKPVLLSRDQIEAARVAMAGYLKV